MRGQKLSNSEGLASEEKEEEDEEEGEWGVGGGRGRRGEEGREEEDVNSICSVSYEQVTGSSCYCHRLITNVDVF